MTCFFLSFLINYISFFLTSSSEIDCLFIYFLPELHSVNIFNRFPNTCRLFLIFNTLWYTIPVYNGNSSSSELNLFVEKCSLIFIFALVHYLFFCKKYLPVSAILLIHLPKMQQLTKNKNYCFLFFSPLWQGSSYFIWMLRIYFYQPILRHFTTFENVFSKRKDSIYTLNCYNETRIRPFAHSRMGV